MASDILIKEQLPHAALIFAGYSGSGKSTLIEQIARLHPREYHESQARFTSRPLRPGETEQSGHFIDQEGFDQIRAANGFVYYYDRYGHSYGFNGNIIQTELKDANTMLVGGKEDTAKELRANLQRYLDAQRMPDILPNPVLLFIQRSRARVIDGIRRRADDPVEAARRIADIEASYSEEPRILSSHEVEIINNDTDDPTIGARMILAVSTKLRQQALSNLLGNNATATDFAKYTAQTATA